MANGQIVWITPTTSAKTSPIFPTGMYTTISVSTTGLGVGETINILTLIGSTNVQVLKLDGTVATLDQNTLGLTLIGGPTYIFDKSATAGTCGLYIDPALK